MGHEEGDKGPESKTFVKIKEGRKRRGKGKIGGTECCRT